MNSKLEERSIRKKSKKPKRIRLSSFFSLSMITACLRDALGVFDYRTALGNTVSTLVYCYCLLLTLVTLVSLTPWSTGSSFWFCLTTCLLSWAILYLLRFCQSLYLRRVGLQAEFLQRFLPTLDSNNPYVKKLVGKSEELEDLLLLYQGVPDQAQSVPKQLQVYLEQNLEKVRLSEVEDSDLIFLEKGDQVMFSAQVISGMAIVDESLVNANPAPVLCSTKLSLTSSKPEGSHSTNFELQKGSLIQAGFLLVRPKHTLEQEQELQASTRDFITVSPSEKSLQYLLTSLTLLFLLVVVSFVIFSHFVAQLNQVQNPVSLAIAVVMLVCLSPLTISSLLPIIKVAGLLILNRLNVVGLSGSTLEEAGNVDTVILNKTGTVTVGKPTVLDLSVFPGIDPKLVHLVIYLSSIYDPSPLGQTIAKYIQNKYCANYDEYLPDIVGKIPNILTNSDKILDKSNEKSNFNSTNEQKVASIADSNQLEQGFAKEDQTLSSTKLTELILARFLKLCPSKIDSYCASANSNRNTDASLPASTLTPKTPGEQTQTTATPDISSLRFQPISFSSSTNLSGLDIEGYKIRKGSFEAVTQWINSRFSPTNRGNKLNNALDVSGTPALSQTLGSFSSLDPGSNTGLINPRLEDDNLKEPGDESSKTYGKTGWQNKESNSTSNLDLREVAKKLQARLEARNPNSTFSLIYVCLDDLPIAYLVLKDNLRLGVKEKIQKLQNLGVNCSMISADSKTSTMAAATITGVDQCQWNATPRQKYEWVKAEQNQGLSVAYSSSSPSDAPALAQANLSLSLQKSDPLSKQASDLIDLDNNPLKIVDIIAQAKRLLITRGSLISFCLANDIARYFALLPSLVIIFYPNLESLNFLHLYSATSALISVLLYNFFIIILLIIFTLFFSYYGKSTRLRIPTNLLLLRNLFLYGILGIAVPLVLIKFFDLSLAVILS